MREDLYFLEDVFIYILMFLAYSVMRKLNVRPYLASLLLKIMHINIAADNKRKKYTEHCSHLFLFFYKKLIYLQYLCVKDAVQKS